MQLFPSMIAVLPGILTGVVSVAAAIGISFAAIVLISSYYRFQHIVEKAEEAESGDGEVSFSDVLRVQLARYFAGCARRGTSFSLSLIQVDNPSVKVSLDSPFITAIQNTVRHDDIACVFDGTTAALITEAEPDDSEPILARVVRCIAKDLPEVSIEMLRVGIASYPGHGLAGSELIRVAREALEKADADQPIFMPEIIDVEEEEEEGEAPSAGVEEPLNGQEADAEDDAARERRPNKWMERRKTAMLDDLTGVLKPSAVSSYMQRMMSDLRHKKKKAALFCIGINNVSHVTRIHGETAVDDILVGVSKVLQDNVRSTDLIGRHEKHAFLVLAEVSLKGAEIIGKRISTLIQHSEITSGAKKIKTSITLGVAAHPEHGRNLHMLYVAGQKVLDYNRENDIRAYAVYDPEIHDTMQVKPIRNIKSVKAGSRKGGEHETRR